jgi:hypothetical protein
LPAFIPNSYQLRWALILVFDTLGRVPDLADHDVTVPIAEPDVNRRVAGLAVEIRGTVTPVIGYLELISEDADGVAERPDAASAERQLEWIATIERRVEALRELNDQISSVCAVLRNSVSDRAAARPASPEALGD